ncbi:hypothetical protein HZA96_03270 [Candidatus Woesearchaeota archaeon]|nr:hypothetical protein [Candidatus Woesearchaeota archaeon]
MATKTITITEDSYQRLNALKEKNESFSLLQLDIESAQKAGMIHINLYDKGMPIQTEDSMIAGICITNNEPLLTRNIKHFNRIDGLKIETY